MIYLAIDIGITGAVASLDHNGRFNIGDIPTKFWKSSPEPKLRIDGNALSLLIRHYVPAEESCLAVIEDVQARPSGVNNGVRHGNSIQSQGSLMRSRGIVEGVLDMLRIRVESIRPQEWKRHYGLMKTEKDAARIKAIALYPDIAEHLARKKDINRADALLIASYAAWRFS